MVGDGVLINVWRDLWIPWLPNFIPIPKNESIPTGPRVVAILIDIITNSWNLTLLSELFDAHSVKAILKIILPASPKKDRLIWVVDPKGKFSIISAFKLFQSPIVTDAVVDWFALWKLKIHDCQKNVFLDNCFGYTFYQAES